MPRPLAALLGWQALFVGNFGWIANLPFVVGLVFLLNGSWRPAVVCSGIALLLALDSLLLVGDRIIADEGGVSQPFLRARFTYLTTRSQKPAVPAINASMPAK